MSDQETLFEEPRSHDLRPWQQPTDPRTKARGSDPETSHAAARINLPGRATQRGRILSVLFGLGPLTDDECWESLDRSIRLNSLTTRRSELVALGLVYDTGERRRTSSGVPAVVWAVTDSAREAMA